MTKRLAMLYDYSGIRDLNLNLSEGTARFYPGKSLKLDFRSAYEMFPDDTAKYFIRESFFTRQVFLNVPADTGKIAGLLDFKSLLLDSGNCAVTPDSLHPDRKLLTIGNLLPAWLALGLMPVAPIRQVSARGWLDARSLEIRHLDVEVYSPGAVPENEVYSLDLDQYRIVQGRLVPGRIRYSLQGMSAELSDSSRTYLVKTSASNLQRNAHLIGLFQDEIEERQYEGGGTAEAGFHANPHPEAENPRGQGRRPAILRGPSWLDNKKAGNKKAGQKSLVAKTRRIRNEPANTYHRMLRWGFGFPGRVWDAEKIIPAMRTGMPRSWIPPSWSQGQGVSFASSRQTLQLFHLDPQISLVTGDTLYSDLYLVSLACSVKVVSQTFKSLPEGGALNSSFLNTSLRTDRRILDSMALASQSGADAGWVYRVAPEAGKTGIAGKVILAARNNRGYMVSIGVVPDSLASWQSRIDAITAGVRFE